MKTHTPRSRLLGLLIALTLAAALGVWAFRGSSRPADPRGSGSPVVNHGGISASDALASLTREQRQIAESQPTLAERDFLARLWVFRDNLSGDPLETEFVVRALITYSDGKDISDAAESMAFMAIGFLARAEAQRGLPASQRAEVLRSAVMLADSLDDGVRLLTAALLMECRRAEGVLKPSDAEFAYLKLMKDEYVMSEIQGQIGVLDKARAMVKK